MDQAAYDSLTPRERECLRLVARDRASDEIATLLERSTGTVENHIKNARAKLGGIDRFTAARLVAEHEGRSQSLASLSLDMSDPAPPDTSSPSDHSAGAGQGGDEVRENRAVFDHAFTDLSPAVAPDRPGERRNDLEFLTRILTIVALFIALAIVILLVFPLSDSFQRLANVIDPPSTPH